MTRSLATGESTNNDQDGNGWRVIVPQTVVVRGSAPMPPAHPGAPRVADLPVEQPRPSPVGSCPLGAATQGFVRRRAAWRRVGRHGMYSMALMTRAGRHAIRALTTPMAFAAVCVVALLAALVLADGGAASAQDADRHRLAVDLARVLIDDQMRQGLSDQVGIGLLQLIGTRLEGRLNRRLQEMEVQTLAEVIRAFVRRTLTEDRIEEIGARVYGSHFDEAELKALAEFQRSAVGRKAARLTPAIARETARAIEGEIAESPALPRLIEELGREFPVLRAPETR